MADPTGNADYVAVDKDHEGATEVSLSAEASDPDLVVAADQSNVPPQPRRSANGMGYAAPVFYPRFLRQLADALDALVAFERPDPSNEEAPHFVGAHHLSWPIYDPEVDENPSLVGWLAQYDAACWVFVPYVAEVEGGGNEASVPVDSHG